MNFGLGNVAGNLLLLKNNQYAEFSQLFSQQQLRFSLSSYMELVIEEINLKFEYFAFDTSFIYICIKYHTYLNYFNVQLI